MKINRNNYEAYFIDYLEGNLEEEVVNDFIEFLQKNPDLKKELSLFESVSAEVEDVVFQHKEKLYKEKFDSEKIFNQTAVANLEGDLSVSEEKEFVDYLSKHPEKKKDLQLFNHTMLTPDESIKFPNKKTLYHYSVGKTVLLWSTRIAAILIVGLAVYWFFNESSKNITPQNQVAAVKDDTAKTEENTGTEETANEQTIPVKKEEPQKVEKVTKEKLQPIDKKTIQPKPTKSLRETTKGRMGSEALALARIPVEVPEKIGSKTASIKVASPGIALAAIPKMNVPLERNPYEEHLLADVVKEKTGLDHLSLNKITKAGLKLVSNISKDKFTYETNEKGKVTELNLDTRLLAFSIPTKNEENGE